ncbi:hypothetical protein J1605_020679 [Eschrichtius robustus]|uniref:Uncharacterized protein n=1 Tax=Eschrichtius robustus TaxID=9764 RepID=A0AB34HL24_ESCRO|nr:hypothetical protein J1605_020679 [Eschrichtius robustus]
MMEEDGEMEEDDQGMEQAGQVDGRKRWREVEEEMEMGGRLRTRASRPAQSSRIGIRLRVHGKADPPLGHLTFGVTGSVLTLTSDPGPVVAWNGSDPTVPSAAGHPLCLISVSVWRPSWALTCFDVRLPCSVSPAPSLGAFPSKRLSSTSERSYRTVDREMVSAAQRLPDVKYVILFPNQRIPDQLVCCLS